MNIGIGGFYIDRMYMIYENLHLLPRKTHANLVYILSISDAFFEQ